MENKETEHYTSDRPIFSEKEDAFQRYPFSKRIADTITNRKSKDSIVFGLFGAWGEGKTSVINFIKKEISSAGDEYIQITFNPWRFTDEAALLTSFFNTLATEIKKAVPIETEEKADSPSKKKGWLKRQKEKWENDKEPLKTNKEAIGDLIQKYGKLAAIFGAGEAAETIGKAISNVDIETLKSRIEKLLEVHKKRIVIFLDDIDRLDKSEIHSIFRLVKLTGDFSYTSYILSFDEEMVASAIGERFGTGDKKAGENFLEKIIQVPLNIPKAQPDALKKFCFKLVDNAINLNSVELKKDEVQRFVYQFTTNVLPRLSTPRLAVRYGNTLSFTMPLLYGEVNMIDLMLVESLRVFYPNHYSFVKDNSDYFIGSYSDGYDRGNNQEKINDFKEHLEKLGKNLTKAENEKVKDLLSNLFPKLKTVFGNYHFSNESYNEWYVQKRIVSTKYFDRYFSYAVLEGDISDIEFSILIEKIRNNDSLEVVSAKISEILKTTSADNFLHKLRSQEKEYDWNSSKIIAKALCDFSESLPSEGGMMSMGFETPFGQAAILILQLFKNNKSETDLFDFAKELMLYPKQFKFAYELNNWFRSGDRPEEKLFSEEQYQELAQILTERAISESGDDSIFEKFPEYISYLGHTWAERDKSDYDEYVKTYLNKDENNIVSLIKSYVPTIRSTAKPEPYKGDLSKDRYDYLVSFYDSKELYDRILSAVPIEELEKEEQSWEERGERDFTEINMLRQFLFWYNKENEKKASNTV
ncbi:P-loop NTPase fold protein [Aquimarina sp. LLG6339-5]|uniref:KAP family P-loop NTPase fold protein n=1 Tax=Aquimarina sp. LLG6339-5 TaxID=3160830 RepID=UPI00386E13CA